MKLADLKNKKILILGLGQEGKDSFLFFRKLFPKKTIGIADKRQFSISNFQFPKAKKHLGKNYLDALKKYDVVIKSPGIPFKVMPKSALKKIITQTDIFFDNCPGIIVGVTGTKGKSTTTALIYAILKAGRRKVHLIGNIGKPVLSFLKNSKENDIYVYELSSHQLFNLKKSPHLAVFLNVFHEHLDYYKSFLEYAKAKANITVHQTGKDFLVYNSKDPLVKKFAQKSKAKKFPITGKYYELDRNAARKVGKILKIPSDKIEKAIKKFKPLPHRMELVGTKNGITFYNDALSTIPETAIAAMDALGENVQTIMLGGFDRGIDFKNLAKRVLSSKIKNLILFPTTGRKIWNEIKKIKKSRMFSVFFVDNMKDAVKIAFESTKKGKICLLSCASTSFSIFRDYREKGNLFKKFVKLLGKRR